MSAVPKRHIIYFILLFLLCGHLCCGKKLKPTNKKKKKVNENCTFSDCIGSSSNFINQLTAVENHWKGWKNKKEKEKKITRRQCYFQCVDSEFVPASAAAALTFRCHSFSALGLGLSIQDMPMLSHFQMNFNAFVVLASKVWTCLCFIFNRQVRAVCNRHEWIKLSIFCSSILFLFYSLTFAMEMPQITVYK